MTCQLHEGVARLRCHCLASGAGSGKIESVNLDPLDLAIRHICETRHLLDGLITSSETFDYRKAKDALYALQLKIRELGRVKASLEGQIISAPNIVPLRLRE